MKTFRKRKNSNSSQTYESLERRLLLAGNVRVATNDGAFFLRGDQDSNQIEIRRSLDNQGPFRVIGVDGTTVNGKPEVIIDSNITNGYRINMGDGDDFIRLEGVHTEGISRIYGGRGNDQVGVFESTVENMVIQTFTGDDSVSIDRVIVNGDLRIATLAGNDDVGISGLRSFGENLVATSTGNDRVSVRDSAVYRESLDILTFAGNDFVGTDNISVAKESRIATGNGNDSVSLFSSQFNSDVHVTGQSGRDLVSVAGRRLNQENINLKSFEGDLVFGNGKANQVFLNQIAEGIRLGTITELASLTPELSTLTSALQQTGLDDALDDERANLTAFAPLNSAFESLPDGLLDSLTDEQLADILLFHVAEGSVFAEQLVELPSVTTLLGESFTVEVGEEVVLNGNVTLAVTDIRAKNGVVHVVNQVLVPAE